MVLVVAAVVGFNEMGEERIKNTGPFKSHPHTLQQMKELGGGA